MTAPAVLVDLADPNVSRCPFQAYEILREEAPVYRDPASGHYVLTRYADVRRALLSTKLLSNRTGLSGAGTRDAQIFSQYVAAHGWPLVESLQNADPPSHTRHRALVAKAFAAPAIAALEPYIGNLVDELLDGVIGKGEVDFVTAYALPLPLRTTVELLGFKDADDAQLMDWAHTLVELTGAELPTERELPLASKLVEMQRFFVANVERARLGAEDTIIGRLVAAADEAGIETPVVLNVISQLITGHHSIAAALSLGLRRLIEQPELAARLRSEPEEISAFLEEVLRLDAPIQVLYRKALEDVEFEGVRVPAGSIVQVRYGAANRDPRAFDDPDRLDGGRDNVSSHLAFGAGPHVCVANQLVRAELRLTFDRLLQRAPRMRFTRGEASSVLEESYVTYGLQHLYCELA